MKFRLFLTLGGSSHSGTQEPHQREKGSGKTKRITLETYVGSVHFLGREESEQFKSEMRKVRNFNHTREIVTIQNVGGLKLGLFWSFIVIIYNLTTMRQEDINDEGYFPLFDNYTCFSLTSSQTLSAILYTLKFLTFLILD